MRPTTDPPKGLWSLSAEREVIGGMLVAPERIADVMGIVGYRDYGSGRHRLYAWAIYELSRRGEEVDALTVSTLLENSQRLEPTDMAELFSMHHSVVSAANILAHARIVRNFARRRKLSVLGSKLMEWAVASGDPEDVLSKLQAAITGLEGQDTEGGPRLVKDILPEVWEDLSQRTEAKGALMGHSVGLPGVDEIIDGLNPRLYVIAGRPAMGKSVFGLQCAHAVANQGHPALVFTLEMSGAEEVHRLLAASAPENYGRLQSARMTAEGWERVSLAGQALAEIPLWIDDASSMRLEVLMSRCRRLHRKKPLGLIVVDYLQQVTAEHSENRTKEVGQISRGLKSLSRELNVPVMALSQLNRDLEKRGNKRPVMPDLRESGELEQDADVVGFLYRDEVYTEDSPDKGFAEFIVGKNRQGRIGTVPLRFFGDECRFAGATELPSKTTGMPVSGGRRYEVRQ